MLDGPLLVHENVTCGGRLSGMVSMIFRSVGNQLSSSASSRSHNCISCAHSLHHTFGNCAQLPNLLCSIPCHLLCCCRASDRDHQGIESQSLRKHCRSCILIFSLHTLVNSRSTWAQAWLHTIAVDSSPAIFAVTELALWSWVPLITIRQSSTYCSLARSDPVDRVLLKSHARGVRQSCPPNPGGQRH